MSVGTQLEKYSTVFLSPTYMTQDNLTRTSLAQVGFCSYKTIVYNTIYVAKINFKELTSFFDIKIFCKKDDGVINKKRKQISNKI